MDSNGFYYNYYLGERDFIRSKETPFNAPYNGFNPKGMVLHADRNKWIELPWNL